MVYIVCTLVLPVCLCVCVCVCVCGISSMYSRIPTVSCVYVCVCVYSLIATLPVYPSHDSVSGVPGLVE